MEGAIAAAILYTCFHTYFYLSDFEALDGAFRLRSKALSLRVALRSIVVVFPVWLILPGVSLEGRQIWTTMALLLLVEPLLLPTPPSSHD